MSPSKRIEREEKPVSDAFIKRVVEKPFENLVEGKEVKGNEQRKAWQELIQAIAGRGAEYLRGRLVKTFTSLTCLSHLEDFREDFGKIDPVPEGVQNMTADEVLELAEQHLRDGTVERRLSKAFNAPMRPGNLAATYGDYSLLIRFLPHALLAEKEPGKVKDMLKDWAEKGGGYEHDMGAQLQILKHIVNFFDAAIDKPNSSIEELPEFEVGLIEEGEVYELKKRMRDAVDKYTKLDDAQKNEVLKKFGDLYKLVSAKG